MKFARTLKYHWLIFRRLQGDPKKLAWGMALGVFIGITPTVPFHHLMVLSLAPLLRVSVVSAYMGIWVMNPVTMVPLYVLAYEVGRLVVFRGEALYIPAQLDWAAGLDLLWRGGIALQLGGLIIAVPPAVAGYFLTLRAVKRYRQSRKNQGVHLVPPDRPAASRPEA